MRQPSVYFRFIKRKIVHDPLPPESIAAGWALGMFVGCAVPFGLQLIISIPLAMMMRVSKLGATLATFITNPVTIFFIYPAQTYVVNKLLFGGSLTFSKLMNIEWCWASETRCRGDGVVLPWRFPECDNNDADYIFRRSSACCVPS